LCWSDPDEPEFVAAQIAKASYSADDGGCLHEMSPIGPESAVFCK
jgi:hypothetical protein